MECISYGKMAEFSHLRHGSILENLTFLSLLSKLNIECIRIVLILKNKPTGKKNIMRFEKKNLQLSNVICVFAIPFSYT